MDRLWAGWARVKSGLGQRIAGCQLVWVSPGLGCPDEMAQHSLRQSNWDTLDYKWHSLRQSNWDTLDYKQHSLGKRNIT